MGTEIFHLNLVSPLYFLPTENPRPFESPAEGENSPGKERIFCFELDPEESLSFEPDQNKLLKCLVSGGEAGEGRSEIPAEIPTEIPKGNYLFAQKREVLGKEDIIAMAIEIQAEGLWQRLKPLKNLYLRYVFEDNSWVTQLFRPYS